MEGSGCGSFECTVILGTCLDRMGEMQSVTAFIPSDVLRNFDMNFFFVSFIIHCEVVAP